METNDIQTHAVIALIAGLLAVGCALGLLYLLGGSVAGKTPIATGRRWMNWVVMLSSTSAFYKFFTSIFGGFGNPTRALVEGMIITIIMAGAAFAIGALVARFRGEAASLNQQEQSVSGLMPKIIIGTIAAAIGILVAIVMPGYHVSNNSDSLIVPDGPIIAPKTNGVALKENGGSINTPISQQEIKALAEQGDAQAQFNLGVAYATGKGLTQNYHEALKWYRLSAAQGNPWAQSNLGGMYRTGIGVPQDYMQAMMWYLIAKASGETNADQDLHQLASVSSPAEIAEAQRMAQEWWAAHHPVN